eukprot:gb/GEZJ01006923.1/.p2 GENE.gb/GEZJ01006923.1/~~gb/GEZJ01006923.1/.p2  ORF type:complete len:128 (+),score=8.22 gb/GEZJ01006923.1/:322-705(+)
MSFEWMNVQHDYSKFGNFRGTEWFRPSRQRPSEGNKKEHVQLVGFVLEKPFVAMDVYSQAPTGYANNQRIGSLKCPSRTILNGMVDTPKRQAELPKVWRSKVAASSASLAKNASVCCRKREKETTEG